MGIKNKLSGLAIASLLMSIFALSAFADVTGVIVASSYPQDCSAVIVGRTYIWKILPSQEMGTGIIGAGGAISFPTPQFGTRDICIKVNGALSVKFTKITMGSSVDLGQILITLPDVLNDDTWDDFELNKINGSFGDTVPSGTGADYNCDGLYDDFDLNQINGGFGSSGECLGLFTNEVNPGEMVYIPAGSFLMGNRGNEPYSYTNEFPQHSVYVSGFWIGKYEVTRGEYRQFINAGGYSNSSYWSTAGWTWRTNNSRTEPAYWAAIQNWGSGKFTQTDNHPVVGVTYFEAEAYCNWAGGRLPTEAEWEKAARWDGSYPKTYTWGDLWNKEYCNNYDDTNPVGGGAYANQTAPIGSYIYSLSSYGCFDMTGNVWEWCKDRYQSDYYNQTPSGGWINPQGPTKGSFNVLRGGGWGYYDVFTLRCAVRIGDNPVTDYNNYGFRIAD